MDHEMAEGLLAVLEQVKDALERIADSLHDEAEVRMKVAAARYDRAGGYGMRSEAEVRSEVWDARNTPFT